MVFLYRRRSGDLPWMQVWRSFSLQRQRHEEQGAGLGTDMVRKKSGNFTLMAGDFSFGLWRWSCIMYF